MPFSAVGTPFWRWAAFPGSRCSQPDHAQLFHEHPFPKINPNTYEISSRVHNEVTACVTIPSQDPKHPYRNTSPPVATAEGMGAVRRVCFMRLNVPAIPIVRLTASKADNRTRDRLQRGRRVTAWQVGSDSFRMPLGVASR